MLGAPVGDADGQPVGEQQDFGLRIRHQDRRTGGDQELRATVDQLV